jgi:hypothetical protein
MSNDMVSRVARAIAETELGAIDQSAIELFLPRFERHACAAIEAMRIDDLKMELAWRKFLLKVKKREDHCWIWLGAIDNRDGYGRFYDGINSGTAYGFAYRYAKGAVPDGLVIDHICANRLCVNPDHLRCVTNTENVLSGNGPSAQHARATVCGQGHEMTEANTYVRPDGNRACRACQQRRSRESKARRRAALSEKP